MRRPLLRRFVAAADEEEEDDDDGAAAVEPPGPHVNDEVTQSLCLCMLTTMAVAASQPAPPRPELCCEDHDLRRLENMEEEADGDKDDDNDDDDASRAAASAAGSSVPLTE